MNELIENNASNSLVEQGSENSFMAMMERLATADNVDVSKIEKMMDLHERILNRNAKQAYMAAFAQMQPELPSVIKTGKTNNATYAKYENIVSAIQEVLGKYGFGFSHRISQANGQIEIVCVLSHRDGHSEETQFIAPADTSGSKNSVQAIGSTISYGKRYTLNALLGIATMDKDPDGNVMIDTEKAAEIDLLIERANADREKFLKYMGVDEVRSIRANEYQKAIASLQAKAKKAVKNG